MGDVERQARVKRRKAQIQKIILGTVAAAGVLSVALIAPNALQALAMLETSISRRKRPIYVVNTAFGRLLEKGYLRIERAGDKKFVRITDSGKIALAKMIAKSPDSRKHRRWDKRWRVVIYDIAEQRKYKRQLLREALERFGFLKLQGSVWIYPYDAEELVKLLKANFRLGKDVMYMVVEHLENDSALRMHFGLKSAKQ